jgi:TatD DNase family protein
MEIFDTHSHLFMEEFDRDREEVFQRAKDAGVTRLVNVGLDVETTMVALSYTKRDEEHYYASAGLHPHYAFRYSEEVLKNLVELAKNKSVVGFGEIGLDFYRNHSSRIDQLNAFRALLKAAVEVHKPVIIHSRDAFQETFNMLKEFKNDLNGILMHCFVGTPKEVERYSSLDTYFAIPGVGPIGRPMILKKLLSLFQSLGYW